MEKSIYYVLPLYYYMVGNIPNCADCVGVV